MICQTPNAENRIVLDNYFLSGDLEKPDTGRRLVCLGLGIKYQPKEKGSNKILSRNAS
tara:strand:- start:827 stop:1000 length:174 start_codon:yes stop_codon:yes gene_type:complete